VADTENPQPSQAGAEPDDGPIRGVAAFFNLSNRMAHLADMRPNAEFHTMGR